MTEAFLLEVLKQYLRKEVHPHDTTDLKQTHTSIAIFSTACYNSMPLSYMNQITIEKSIESIFLGANLVLDYALACGSRNREHGN